MDRIKMRAKLDGLGCSCWPTLTADRPEDDPEARYTLLHDPDCGLRRSEKEAAR